MPPPKTAAQEIMEEEDRRCLRILHDVATGHRVEEWDESRGRGLCLRCGLRIGMNDDTECFMKPLYDVHEG